MRVKEKPEVEFQHDFPAGHEIRTPTTHPYHPESHMTLRQGITGSCTYTGLFFFFFLASSHNLRFDPPGWHCASYQRCLTGASLVICRFACEDWGNPRIDATAFESSFVF